MRRGIPDTYTYQDSQPGVPIESISSLSSALGVNKVIVYVGIKSLHAQL